MDDEKMKKCPYCGEDIRQEAVKCRFCLSMLAGEQEVKAPPEQEAEAGDGGREKFFSTYGKAGLGKRFLAFLVDSVVASLGFFLLVPMLLPRLFVMFNQAFPYRTYHYSYNPGSINYTFLASMGFFLLLAGLWAVAYYLLKDGFGRGQSLGKRFAGLMVVQLDNDRPCSFGSSLLRNLVHLLLYAVPGIGFFIEPVVLTLHEKGQRLGDLAGRTQVIEVAEYKS